jgi:cell division transport system permease protein
VAKLVRLVFSTIKFLSVIFLSSFFVLISNYYYQLQSYVLSLYDELNIVVFFKDNVKDINVLADEIKNVETVSIKELVDSSQSYLKALEKNPFLKDISTSDNMESIGSYAVILPQEVFDENYLLKIRNGIEAINGVDEVVFDSYSFNQYKKLKNLLILCEKTFFSILIAFGILFIFKVIFSVFLQKVSLKKIAQKFCFYFMAASIGFFVVWMLSMFSHCDLSMDKSLILLVIPFTTVFGLIFDNHL